jgi:predicted metal-dependent hydrolase
MSRNHGMNKRSLNLEVTEASRTSAGELRCVNLNGKEVAYMLKRCRRRTIGMRIDNRGLTVRIPSRESLRRVESVLKDKADWVISKLDEWKNRKSTQLAWEEEAVFPLLGEPWRIRVTPAGEIQMVPARILLSDENKQLKLALSPRLDTRQIEKSVMSWYRNRALTCFSERIAVYAPKLGVPLPTLRLSRAASLWGSCNARGVVRLNWRLIQMPLHLIDYVVAHELAHLIEMNHSAAFWQTVGCIYPGYREARKELKKLA